MDEGERKEGHVQVYGLASSRLRGHPPGRGHMRKPTEEVRAEDTNVSISSTESRKALGVITQSVYRE